MNRLLAIQSALITLQIVNAGIATVTHNALIALIIGAVVGGIQNYVQHAGNQSEPK
jgi:hypothetical protein